MNLDTVAMSPEAARHYYQHKTQRWSFITDLIKLVVVTLAILAALAGLGFIIKVNIDSDRAIELACVHAGKEWVTDSCVGAAK